MNLVILFEKLGFVSNKPGNSFGKYGSMVAVSNKHGNCFGKFGN